MRTRIAVAAIALVLGLWPQFASADLPQDNLACVVESLAFPDFDLQELQFRGPRLPACKRPQETAQSVAPKRLRTTIEPLPIESPSVWHGFCFTQFHRFGPSWPLGFPQPSGQFFCHPPRWRRES